MNSQKKEVEISLEKRYVLPSYKIVEYNDFNIVVFFEIAKWIIICNEKQKHIFTSISEGKKIKELLQLYPDNENNIIYLLTQLEAKNVERTVQRSIFENRKLHLHLTNRCNLRCPHCYMKSGNFFEKELSFDEIKKLCTDFKSVGGTHLSLTGGEPTVRNDFEDILVYACDIGLKVSIFSNGCLWDNEKIKRINKDNLEGVQISVDGYDEESNSVVRGKGSFEKAIKTIDLFVQNGIKVKIAVTPDYEFLKNHKEDYVLFAKNLLEKYGKKVEINYSYYLMEGRELSYEKVLSRKSEYYSLIDDIVKQLYENIEEDSFIENIRENKIFDSCGYGGLNVMANGDYYFCDRIPDVSKIGNVLDEPFDIIFLKMKKAEEAGKVDNFKPCGDCELKYICGGGCRAEYFKEFTNINDIENIDFNKIKPRICQNENKEKFYSLMIKLNERFYE